MGIYYNSGPSFDGSTSSRAAPSAAAIKYWNPRATSGIYYIKPNGYSTAIQVYCDMQTPDEFGFFGGWMLVGSWTTPYQWTLTANSSNSVFSTTPMNCVSSNFGNVKINAFRVQAASTPLSESIVDWYYYYTNKVYWKELWSPDGNNYQYYLSSGSVPRQCLKPFTHSYNIKFDYKNPEHIFNNLSDYGYQNTQTNNVALIGGTLASSTGFCNYWNALTTSGQPFGVYNNSYTGTFTTGDAPVSDGSLAIPVKGSGANTSGQDVDNNVSVKIGYDDGGIWNSAATSDTVATSNVGNVTVPLWWWIK